MSSKNDEAPDPFAELQRWYQTECNGDWEHSFGIVIETLDNPGWSVTVDLDETELACRTSVSITNSESETDWYHIRIDEERFVATGDSSKLRFLIQYFVNFSKSIEGQESS